ncbi:MAG: DinB family protein [Cyanobacteriota bacterium]|nr:DinB family protein [Cyanobacteriota bacterium]
MITPEYGQVLASYNQWMNDKLYRICQGIPQEERQQERGAFFKSIDGTLNHLLVGDKIWLGRFINQPFRAPLNQTLYADFADLWQERQRVDQQLLDWASGLSQEWLAQPFSWTSGSDGETRIRPTWLLVAHLFNHQTHHRGQLTTLLSQMGRDPGVTDLPWMPTFHEAQGSS